MSVKTRSYKEASREYLLEILEKEKKLEYHKIKECGCCYYEKILYHQLKEKGFFSYNKTINWWRLEVDKDFDTLYTPIKDE